MHDYFGQRARRLAEMSLATLSALHDTARRNPLYIQVEGISLGFGAGLRSLHEQVGDGRRVRPGWLPVKGKELVQKENKKAPRCKTAGPSR